MDEQSDLSLNPDDAENVLGGTKKAKKTAKKGTTHHAASSAIIVNMPPMNTSPDDHSVADAPQGDDPDC